MLEEILKLDCNIFDNALVISPDMGAMERARYYADMLGVDVGVFYKRRDLTKIVNGKNPIVAHEFLGDNIDGKDVIIIDDMIASGGSMLDVAKQVKERGAKRVFVCCTFGLFTEGFEKFDEYYEKGYIEKVFTTNLIYNPPELLERPWYSNVNMSKYIAYLIDRLNYDNSISSLLNPVDRINNFLIKKGFKDKED